MNFNRQEYKNKLRNEIDYHLSFNQGLLEFRDLNPESKDEIYFFYLKSLKSPDVASIIDDVSYDAVSEFVMSLYRFLYYSSNKGSDEFNESVNDLVNILRKKAGNYLNSQINEDLDILLLERQEEQARYMEDF